MRTTTRCYTYRHVAFLFVHVLFFLVVTSTTTTTVAGFTVTTTTTTTTIATTLRQLAPQPPSLIPKKNRQHSSTSLQISKSSSILSTAATTALTTLRGGSTTELITSKMSQITSIIVSSLQKGGGYGILGLWSIASLVLIPLTLYRQGFSFSVGYGYSVMTMGIALLLSSGFTVSSLLSSFSTLPNIDASLLLATVVIFYGLRLGSFLLLRNAMTYKGKQMKTFDKSPPLQRIPLALSVGLFYAFMVTPAMYALQSNVNNIVSYTGAGIAWAGALLEAIADGHKFIVKRANKSSSSDIKSSDDDTEFVGPTGGVYKLCRHPNYLGEILMWLGLFIRGIPSFGVKSNISQSIPGWACSFLGLYGIWGIMTNATKRLDQQQYDKYSKQDKYNSYITKVNSPLIPFMDYPSSTDNKKSD